MIHKNAGTVEETHVLESSGKVTKDFSEEHWSSKIKSYKTPQPPKFIQVSLTVKLYIVEDCCKKFTEILA